LKLHTGRRWLVFALATGALAGCGSQHGDSLLAPGADSKAKPATAAVGGNTAPGGAQVSGGKDGLLAPADVGSGFTASTYEDRDTAGPCGKPTMKSRFGNTTRFGATVLRESNETFAAVQETVTVFPDDLTTLSAYEVNVDELNCRSGSVGSSGDKLTVTIGAPTDVAATVGVEKATSWTLRSSGRASNNLVLMSIMLKNAVVQLTFEASSEKIIPDTVAVAKKAVAKLTTS
jgi:hypothetical protein